MVAHAVSLRTEIFGDGQMRFGFAIALSVMMWLATTLYWIESFYARMEGLRRQCASQIVVLDGQELGFSVSMGVASFPHTAASQPELMAACEAALAAARACGGNHLTLASIRFENP